MSLPFLCAATGKKALIFNRRKNFTAAGYTPNAANLTSNSKFKGG